MMTPAELFRELLKPDGKPERQLKQYEALRIVFNNPVDAYLRANYRPGATFLDRWGTTIMFPENSPGPMPHITEENKVCPDITRWRETCHAPDLIANCRDGWERALESADRGRQKGQLVTALLGTGIFEQCHFLMGFEDTLTGFYEHPDEMHALIDYILEYRMTMLELIIENLKPDAILSHDDWGAKDALFMQPDIWREFFKEPYRRFYGRIREAGIITIHHADSYLVPIIEDMVEIGIQCWQGVLPENNIPALQEQLQGRMVLMGGIGATIDRADAQEQEIHDYVMSALKEYCPRGHYLPCITYGAPGAVYPQVDPVIDGTIAEYNLQYHLPSYRCAAPAKRVTAAVADTPGQQATTQADTTDESITARISRALQRGKLKQTVRLCSEALEQGLDAQDILSQGLIAGMVRLGDDYSAGKVFVPEMLMGAKCMNAATELLKPMLVQNTTDSPGRVCIGTVKGDMHDIGKNLVKIMMEGSGLEVIDLGCDVPAEQYVETAREQHCDIIACSALLTTTMDEMRRVVTLTEEAGIRENTIIMVGGAPITQEYCDEIGADLYTADAASAARAAVQALHARRS